MFFLCVCDVCIDWLTAVCPQAVDVTGHTVPSATASDPREPANDHFIDYGLFSVFYWLDVFIPESTIQIDTN